MAKKRDGFPTYVAKTKYSLRIELRDENGKKIPVCHPVSGQPVVDGNQIRYASETIIFRNVCDNPRIGIQWVYTPRNKWENEELEKAVDNRFLFTEDTYKKKMNPKAYEQEKKAEEMEEKADALASENEQLKQKLEALQKNASSGVIRNSQQR